MLLLAFTAVTAFAKPDPRITASAGRILKLRCSACHGKRLPERGINVLDRNTLIKVGVLEPANENSTLLVVVESGRMPLHGPPLPPDEIAEIRKWILQGAQQFKRK